MIKIFYEYIYVFGMNLLNKINDTICFIYINLNFNKLLLKWEC